VSKLNVLVVGSTGAIGSALSDMLSSQHNVIRHWHKKPSKENAYHADIREFDEVNAMFESILEHHDHIDAAIVASGLSKDGMCHKFEDTAWSEVVHVNLVGTFNVIRGLLPRMRERRFGRIIVLSSVVFQNPVVGTSAYSASKAGLVGLTRTVALENAEMGITCNCITLGYFEAGILFSIPDDLRGQIRKSIPMKRFGRVDEIFDLITYLLNADYITGQAISINGGLYMA